MSDSKGQRTHAQSSIRGHEPVEPKGKVLAFLALGALGIVYGDIGTSPLYAFRESFHEGYGIPVTPENVLGVLSLDIPQISYFLGRERLFAMKGSDMAVWRQQLFAFMSRNANNATDFFQLPPDQVVEMGTQVVEMGTQVEM